MIIFIIIVKAFYLWISLIFSKSHCVLMFFSRLFFLGCFSPHASQCMESSFLSFSTLDCHSEKPAVGFGQEERWCYVGCTENKTKDWLRVTNGAPLVQHGIDVTLRYVLQNIKLLLNCLSYRLTPNCVKTERFSAFHGTLTLGLGDQWCIRLGCFLGGDIDRVQRQHQNLYVVTLSTK